jgi:hypothetical protein
MRKDLLLIIDKDSRDMLGSLDVAFRSSTHLIFLRSLNLQALDKFMQKVVLILELL